MSAFASGIALIESEPFARSSFFGDGCPIPLYFGDNFWEQVFAHVPEVVPAFQGKVVMIEAIKGDLASGFLTGLGRLRPFSPPEFASVVRGLVCHQPEEGKEEFLSTDGHRNVFPVRPTENGCPVTVSVRRLVCDDWRLAVSGPDNLCLGRGDRRFSLWS